ncbi:unnamed protein product, partial [Polarella glacialis]
ANTSSDSYYDVLELGRDASTQDVKKQFRKLSIKLHPDKKGALTDTEAGRQAFARLQLANEWLSSDDRKQLYDLYGEWASLDDRLRGQRFAGKHTAIEFFRDEPLIHNVRTEAEAKEIFGLKSERPYLMMLYVPWLTGCVEAADVYRKVAGALLEETGENGIRLAAVNCESNLQSFCQRYGRLRSQFSLPVVLLLDPSESLIDRYRGVMSVDALSEYTIASDKGIQHVHLLDEQSFQARILNAPTPAVDFWLVLFCAKSEPLCTDLKPVLKRLAFSAKAAAKVGLVNCKEQRSADGYMELEQFCEDQGVQEVPTLLGYRRGVRSEKGEHIPLLLPRDDEDPVLAAPLASLRAMEAVLRLSAPAASRDKEGGPDDESSRAEWAPRSREL